MKWEDLNQQQREELQQSLIVASKAIIDAFETVFSAMQPALNMIKEFYDQLPKDVKEQIAALQVEEKLKRDNIDALKTIDPKQHFIAQRLDYYSKYWNPKTKMFEIDKGNEQSEWIVSREDLIKDLGKSWEFENGS